MWDSKCLLRRMKWLGRPICLIGISECSTTKEKTEMFGIERNKREMENPGDIYS